MKCIYKDCQMTLGKPIGGGQAICWLHLQAQPEAVYQAVSKLEWVHLERQNAAPAAERRGE